MGAMTTNRKRTEECMNVNLTNSDSSRKRSRLSTKPVPSAASAIARLYRYPQVNAPFAREVHAPCRPTKFPLSARVSSRTGDAMGNVLIAKFEKAKSSALEKCRSVVEKGKEVIVVDAESNEPCADSSVEELHDDGGKFGVQRQSTLSFDSELRNAELKVASRGELWGSETQLDVESVHAYKKLLEDVGRRNGTFQRLNFEIDLNEKRRDHFNLLRPKKELEESEALKEPFVALSSEEEDEVERAFSANRWKILVTHENSNIEITGEKFQCLRSTGWLNDEVINLYLSLLKEREQRQSHKFLKCHFFNTFFYKKLISGPNGYDFKSVRRWTSQRKLGYSLLECDKIFVPIHQEIHWCLAVINNKDKKLQYLDSMKGEDRSVLEKLVQAFV